MATPPPILSIRYFCVVGEFWCIKSRPLGRPTSKTESVDRPKPTRDKPKNAVQNGFIISLKDPAYRGGFQSAFNDVPRLLPIAPKQLRIRAAHIIRIDGQRRFQLSVNRVSLCAKDDAGC